MIEEIKSKNNSLIKYIYKLKNNSFSKSEKKFVIEGEHLCEMAGENLLFILTEHKMDETKFPNQYIVTNEILEKLSEGKSVARIIGVCKCIDSYDKLSNSVLFLDDVQDPGNVGTIFRTALGFKFKTIFVTPKRLIDITLKLYKLHKALFLNLI